MNPVTRQKYVKTWTAFTKQHGITVDKPPTQQDFLDYLGKRKSIDKVGYNTIKSEHSHLNKAVKNLYDYNLSKWPRIWEFVKSTGQGNLSGILDSKIKILALMISKLIWNF